MTPITIKGQSLDAWEKWLVNELTPPLAPITQKPEVRYVIEGMLELVRAVKDQG